VQILKLKALDVTVSQDTFDLFRKKKDGHKTGENISGNAAS
jgi:hypothetical protein